MNDMAAIIVPKSDQMNADDLDAGPVTITITGTDIQPGAEQPFTVHFQGDNGRPWKPCKSMARVMVAGWGPDSSAYTGRSLTLYRDPTVKWGGLEVGGIRVSHMSHIDRGMVLALTATKGSRKPYQVKPLEIQQDKIALAVAALVARIDSAITSAELEAITADAKVISQRAWLAKNRSDEARQVDDRIAAALARMLADEPFDPDPQPEPEPAV